MPKAQLSVVGVAAVLCARLAAQTCTTTAIPGDGCPGVNGTVNAMTDWDPDGPGPLPVVHVVAGVFTLAGRTPAQNIAVWDGIAFRALGAGVPGQVLSVCGLSDGTLLAGTFNTSGANAPAVWRWDGQSWSAVGGPFLNSGPVQLFALTQLPGGDIVAGGSFTSAGGTSAANIARWNGSAWSSMNSGFNARVRALAVTADGTLYAGGWFDSPSFIARWTGSNWAGVGGQSLDGYVYALSPEPDGGLLVAGAFAHAGASSARGIARWRAGAWSALGTGPASPVFAVRSLPSGQALIAAYFNGVGSGLGISAARWDGSAWQFAPEQLFDGGATNVYAVLPLSDGSALVGGNFQTAGASVASRLVRLDTGQWTTLAPGMHAPANVVLPLPGGDAIVGGEFRSAGSLNALRVARWTPTGWQLMGPGLNGSVYAAARLADGRIVVGGAFSQSGNTAAMRVAAWDGSSWAQLGGGFDSTVKELIVSTDGTLYAAGVFTHSGALLVNHVAKWDPAGGSAGTGAWAALGSGLNGNADAMTYVPGLGLVVGGTFTQAGGTPAANVARWDGGAWQPMGVGFNNTVSALACSPAGELLAGGWFSASGGITVNRVARWSGSVWTPIGAGVGDPNSIVWSVAFTRQGEPLIGGSFTAAGGGPADRLALWDGTAWVSVAPGIDQGIGAVSVLEDGTIAVGGSFTVVGEAVSAFFARVRRTCACGAADIASTGAVAGADGLLDNNDFVVFVDYFFTHNPLADVGGTGGVPGADGEFNNNDFVAYIDLFFGRC